MLRMQGGRTGQIWSCLAGYGTFDRFAIRGPHSTIGEKYRYLFYLEIYITGTGPQELAPSVGTSHEKLASDPVNKGPGPHRPLVGSSVRPACSA